tara:strand:- start:203 stop:1183 length:981 start_codon:yes stop_codon:yes gene_type:complete
MSKIIKLIADQNNISKRVDIFISKNEKDISRTRVKNLILEGCLKVNNYKTLDPDKKIKINDIIELKIPSPKKTILKPKKIALNILYEDNDIIVIDKSPGVVVHPGAGNYENTIVNGLLHKYKNNLSSVGGKLRPGIVHRIDKDTSGVIVIAKNDKAHINLSEQFKKHTIKRIYEALVWGSLKPQNGKINERISRSRKNRQLMSIKQGTGKIAITNYKTIKIFQNTNLPKISLIECKLETGRTHQIRVHMNFKGNSIIGDKSYGRSKKKFKTIDPSIEKEINNFSRQALHAKSLAFIHPTSFKEIYFEARRPLDFDKLIKSLNKASV